MKSSTVRERFERHTTPEPNSGCWLWTAAIDRGTGYGCINTGGKNENAHRVSYRLFCGEIPELMSVLHRCDNRACVNPDHLFIGTQLDNMRDMHRKGRASYHKAKLTEDQVMQIRILLAYGYKQADVAEIYSVSVPQISRIGSGKDWPSIKAA